ncbi:MAG: hypothetical protein QOG51_309 [Verrucomicrobiota bacterium]|jgi:hypothetical protein
MRVPGCCVGALGTPLDGVTNFPACAGWFIDALGSSDGVGVSVYRRAGEIPWRARIVPARRRMASRRARKTPENRTEAGFCGK